MNAIVYMGRNGFRFSSPGFYSVSISHKEMRRWPARCIGRDCFFHNDRMVEMTSMVFRHMFPDIHLHKGEQISVEVSARVRGGVA